MSTGKPNPSAHSASAPQLAIVACTTIEAMRPWRGLTRSDRMPNQGARTSAGPNIIAAVTPTQVADTVSSQALQPSRKRSIQAPRLENQLAGKYRRKALSRRAERLTCRFSRRSKKVPLDFATPQ